VIIITIAHTNSGLIQRVIWKLQLKRVSKSGYSSARVVNVLRQKAAGQAAGGVDPDLRRQPAAPKRGVIHRAKAGALGRGRLGPTGPALTPSSCAVPRPCRATAWPLSATPAASSGLF